MEPCDSLHEDKMILEEYTLFSIAVLNLDDCELKFTKIIVIIKYLVSALFFFKSDSNQI